jgi:tetratricopeptide (TPR) repeat protein
MNLRPWQLWNKDGTPAEGTEEIVTVLESVLKRNPDHVGANHYYIHAVEASLKPERALPSAQRLITLVPAAGHLVHMPAHIYMRTGDYKSAATRNQVAAEVDEEYIKSYDIQGIYPLMYYSHNLHFLAVAHSMQGRFSDAKNAADQLEAHVSPYVKEMPMLEFFVPTSTLILVSFDRWEDILRSPKPDPNMLITTAVWHFARGMAYAANGKLIKAEKEQKLFVDIKNEISADSMWDLNSTSDVLGIAGKVLDAKIAIAKGDKKSAVVLLRQAAEAEDGLNYAEPTDWYIPVRESLGAVLFMTGEYAEAEKVFRTDLEKNPRSGRSLFGLLQSLKAQKKDYEARLVQTEFEAAWKNADTQLHVKDL